MAFAYLIDYTGAKREVRSYYAPIKDDTYPEIPLQDPQVGRLYSNKLKAWITVSRRHTETPEEALERVAREHSADANYA